MAAEHPSDGTPRYAGPWIDAHVHQWDPRTSPRSASTAVKLLGWSPRLLHAVAARAFPPVLLDFVGDPDLALQAYLPGMWRADTAERDVRGFVHVQADWSGRGPLAAVDETVWLEQVCGRDLLAVVGRADLASPSLDRVLDGHATASPRFRGVRDYVAHGRGNPGLVDWAPSPDLTTDRAWRRGYERLGERGLSFDVWAYGHQLPAVAALVGDHPGTPVVIDHLGSPVGFGGAYAGRGVTPAERDQILGRWREDLAALAAHDHVHVKISGLAMTISGFGWHRRGVPPSVDEVVEAYQPLVHHALEVFGPQRCMAASNFPMDRVSLRWPTLFEALETLLSHLTAADRQAVLHDTAARFYRIG